MKPSQAYVRVTLVSEADLEVVVGVEIGSGEDPHILYGELRASIWPVDVTGKNDLQIAQVIEQAVLFYYPGRSYFLEVGRGEGDEYVQIFQPKSENIS